MAGAKTRENPGIIRLRTRYDALAAQLKETGLLLQGTITERIIEPLNDKGKTYGPYYQWTRKIRAKTVTVNLSPSQAKVYQMAIDNNKRMERVINGMRDLSLKICAASTVGVKKRRF
ncbi:MAG: hypothetical protein Q8O90_03460 [Elusimicrobiota bacterium]|nr:hypothetical protein [Elusimicrobiota bacterium]